MPVFTGGSSQVGSANIIDGAIVNADINAAAAIEASKLSGLPYTTLTSKVSAGGVTTVTTDAFTGKKFLRIIFNITSLALASDLFLRFNSDAGANYNSTISLSGGGASKLTAQTSLRLITSAQAGGCYGVLDVLNVATKTKPLCGLVYEYDDSCETAGHWLNTADLITSVSLVSAQNMGADTSIIVLGMD